MEPNEFQLDRDTENLIRELVRYLDDWGKASSEAHRYPDTTGMIPQEEEKLYRERDERVRKFCEIPVIRLWDMSGPNIPDGRLLELVLKVKTLAARERTAAALERIASQLESKEK